VDILADKLDFYMLMVDIFFKRLDHVERMSALIEIAETLREEREIIDE